MERIFVAISLTVLSAHGNFYFVTHPSYRNMTYNTSGYTTFKIAGDVTCVTQQCRRFCTLERKCAACNVTLLDGSTELGIFRCRIFVANSCYWKAVSLQDKSTPDATDLLWEKLEAVQRKPKPCIEYCAVKYRGNCTACRGYDILKGPDCDEAPKLCSDYPWMSPGFQSLPIWPWGFYRRKLEVKCRDGQTPLIIRDFYGGKMDIVSPAFSGLISVSNVAAYVNILETLDWELLSELQALSLKKILTVYFASGAVYNFSGFQLSPHGALTLNGSLGSPPSTGFPASLFQVPFVKGPSTTGSTCGPFWQFEPNVDVCTQRTNLLNFGDIKWDGALFNSSPVAIMFS